jgi:hypothetical protein
METELSLTRQGGDRETETSPTDTPPTEARRAHPRHELRTLTYACLDQANGGIVRDLSHQGLGLQVVAAVRPQQQLRVRFELGHPRLRVEARGEVSWATRSGQCGIRFLDLSPKAARQINEWIFGNLLEEVSRHSEREGSMFTLDAEVADGLMVSAAPVSAIRLPLHPDPLEPPNARNSGSSLQSLQSLQSFQSFQSLASTETEAEAETELDWLSQPLSGRRLVWTINTLVIVAALLLFALVFLSITGELPRWPLATASAATIVVAGLYWGFFRLFGKSSPGERLARLAGWNLAEDVDEYDARFR